MTELTVQRVAIVAVQFRRWYIKNSNQILFKKAKNPSKNPTTNIFYDFLLNTKPYIKKQTLQNKKDDDKI